MIILECEQLDSEWWQAHVGTPSASNFSDILTPTGKPSVSAKDYKKAIDSLKDIKAERKKPRREPGEEG